LAAEVNHKGAWELVSCVGAAPPRDDRSGCWPSGLTNLNKI